MALEKSPHGIDSNNKIYRKAIFQVVGIAFLIACGILGVFYFLTTQIYETEMEQTEASLIQLVTIAKSSIEPIAREVESGSLTVEQGQNMARNIVRRMVYQDTYGANYIFMSSYEGIMLVQPFSSSLEGSNQLDLQDVNGKYIIRSLIEAAKTKPSGSFVTYYYPPPRSTTPEQKISYVIGVPEINAYIGAGIYPSQAYKQQRILLIILGSITVLLLGLLATLTVQTLNKVRMTADSLLKQKKAEENLSTVFNSTHDAILIHDRFGKIIAANPAMLKMYRINRDDLTSLSVRDISAEDSKQSFLLEDLWIRVNQGENLLFEWLSIRPHDKTAFEVEVSLSLISWNEESHFLAVIRDVTDRNKIQADLEKNEWLLEHAQSLAHIGHFYYELATNQLTWSKELFHIYGLEPQAEPPTDISFPQMTIGRNIHADGLGNNPDPGRRIATE
jgi:PAS domain S-box-containing protein